MAGFIGELVIEGKILEEGFVDLGLADLELGLQLHLVKFKVHNAEHVSLRVQLHLLDLLLLFLRIDAKLRFA